jgi:hypothetical protein
MDKKPKQIEFKNGFLSSLRKNAKPLPQAIKEEIANPIKVPDNKKAFLSTYDTSSLNIEIK